jgi:hypothetical protein
MDIDAATAAAVVVGMDVFSLSLITLVRLFVFQTVC